MAKAANGGTKKVVKQVAPIVTAPRVTAPAPKVQAAPVPAVQQPVYTGAAAAQQAAEAVPGYVPYTAPTPYPAAQYMAPELAPKMPAPVPTTVSGGIRWSETPIGQPYTNAWRFMSLPEVLGVAANWITAANIEANKLYEGPYPSSLALGYEAMTPTGEWPTTVPYGPGGVGPYTYGPSRTPQGYKYRPAGMSASGVPAPKMIGAGMAAAMGWEKATETPPLPPVEGYYDYQDYYPSDGGWGGWPGTGIDRRAAFGLGLWNWRIG